MPDVPVALSSVPPPPHVQDVLDGLRRAGARAYLVGGCVRDLLLGSAPKDYDIATSARPEEVQRAFKKVIPTGIAHGTVTVLSHGHHVEVTTFRSEGAYVDGRRPSTVTFETEIEADLSRRDFTINAMAYDPGGHDLRDPFGGQEDLKLRRIRCVGEAHDRFAEDGLRPLRAVRFAAVLGFEIEPSTLAAISSAIGSFRKISAERIREEFSKLLVSRNASSGVALLRSSGLLSEFLPELAAGLPDALWTRSLAMLSLVPPELEIRLGAAMSRLSHPPQGAIAARAALVRLTYPNRTADHVALWVENLSQLTTPQTWTAPAVRRFLAKIGTDALDPLWTLAEAQLQADSQDLSGHWRTRTQFARVVAGNPALSTKQLALKGADLMRILAVGPSPAVGDATRFLLEQVLDDPTLNTAEKLSDALRKWAKDRGL